MYPAMRDLATLFLQYEILERTAQYLSAHDLLHVALTCSELYCVIAKPNNIFDRLKRVSICDGYGLKLRQEFQGLYQPNPIYYKWGTGRKPHYDEEIEVRLYNLKCDAVNALPCLKCGINICEECRYVPRSRDQPNASSRRRPHLDTAYQSHDVICYCTDCDEKIEKSLPLHLSEFCDCDQYTRWICHRCRVKELKADSEYLKTRTKQEFDCSEEEFEDGGMFLMDNQFERAFWCPCGKRAPQDGNVRCAWCLRKHNLEVWMNESPSYIPFFDDDPCFPKLVLDHVTHEPIAYPDLQYRGPIAP